MWERYAGTLPLLVAAPTSPVLVFMGRSVQWMLDGLAASCLSLLVLAPLFGVVLPWPAVLAFVPLMALVCLSTYMTATFFGSLALRLTDARNLIGVTMSTSLMLFCGVNVAVSSLPQWAAAVSNMSSSGPEGGAQFGMGDGMTAIGRDVTTEAIVERARSLAPTISERALEGEQARRVPDDVFRQMREGGLLRLFVPKVLGGLEVDPFTMIEVIETISRADGSTGWVAMILNGTFMTAWVEPTAAKQMAASVDGDVVLSGMFSPMGRATADADGFRVTGRWPFISGSSHANWTLGGTLIMDGSNPVMRPDGQPDWRFMMFPMTDTVVHDTWRAAGLKATASHDLSVDNVYVPEELTPRPLFDVPRHDGPLWRFSFFGLLGCCMVGVPLGIARRALDEAVPLSQTKSRNGGRSTMAEDGAVQLDLIRAETALRAARSLVFEAIGTAWEHALAGNPMSTDDRLAVRLASFHAAEVGLRVVETCFRIGGGGALYEHSPLQRCWRDLHAASHHLFFGDQSLQDIARVHLGLEADTLTM